MAGVCRRPSVCSDLTNERIAILVRLRQIKYQHICFVPLQCFESFSRGEGCFGFGAGRGQQSGKNLESVSIIIHQQYLQTVEERARLEFRVVLSTKISRGVPSDARFGSDWKRNGKCCATPQARAVRSDGATRQLNQMSDNSQPQAKPAMHTR